MQTEPIILVAEDDDGHLYLLKRELKRNNIPWPIWRFADGQQAIDFFQREFRSMQHDGPVIFLLDLRLPKVSGTEILARIRSSDYPPLRELPVLIITSSFNPDDRQECLRLGCNGYLTKPFSPGEMKAAIEGLLPAILAGPVA